MINGGGSGRPALETAAADLPNVVVTQLALHPTTRKLVAATYGRGFFEIALDELAPPEEVLYRGTVADPAGTWRTGALPLDSSNDAETPPFFPLPTHRPGTAVDDLATGDRLVLYRLLGPAEEPMGNILRGVKSPTGVTLSY